MRIAVTIIVLILVVWAVWNKTRHRPDIRGDWEVACENSIQRHLQLTANEWVLTQTVYADSACERQAYMLQTIGVYELGDKSAEIEGATHAEFIRRELHLTAFTLESAQVFEQNHCGNTKWETDTTTIVSHTGCVGIAPSISVCPTEYDLVKRDDGLLYFGDRSESLCERGVWPKALNPTPLRRAD